MTAIPLHILSGFLGSGKTTFMKEIISRIPESKKTGIIVNEFAASSADNIELRGNGGKFEILEINNGSVFCVCLMGEFAQLLDAFIEIHSPQLLILEASGLSDTTSLAALFSKGPLSEKIFLAANWCIVDALNFYRVGKMQQRVLHQIKMADVILVNKIDLAGDKVPGTVNAVRKINPFADIVTTSWCRVPFQFDRLPVPRFYPDTVKPEGKPDIRSMVYKTNRSIRYDRLIDFLNLWAPLAYRIKGYVSTADFDEVAVQCTPGTVETKPAARWKGPTELVVLSDRFTIEEFTLSFRQHLDD